MEFYMVDVSAIIPPTEKPYLDEWLASSVASIGLVMPLLLEQVSATQYRILEGHQVYWAAVRAKELSPRACEMVNAFVVDRNVEQAIEQYRYFTHQEWV